MPYIDLGGVTFWKNPREAHLFRQKDSYQRAAEWLAADVEEFLYREFKSDGTANPAFANVDFLAWAVARYDSTKRSSGHQWHGHHGDPAQELAGIPFDEAFVPYAEAKTRSEVGVAPTLRKVGKSKANHEGLVLQTEEPAVRKYAQPTEPLPEPTFTDNPDPLPE